MLFVKHKNINGKEFVCIQLLIQYKIRQYLPDLLACSLFWIRKVSILDMLNERIDGGNSEMEFAELDVAAESIDTFVMFHLVMDILGFVLYMHEQIHS